MHVTQLHMSRQRLVCRIRMSTFTVRFECTTTTPCAVPVVDRASLRGGVQSPGLLGPSPMRLTHCTLHAQVKHHGMGCDSKICTVL